jgi:hypothetical protein
MLEEMDTQKLLKIGKIAWTALVYIFAAIGLMFVAVYIALQLGLTKTSGIIDQQRQSFLNGATASSSTAASAAALAPTYPNGTPWQDTQEWQTISLALQKDTNALDTASQTSGVPARLIVANLIVEQLRLFFTERGYYEQFFAPLKILGAQTQFSLGVMGMKDATAAGVENNLKDSSSPFYLGDQYAHLLDYPASSTANITDQRYARLTDQHNHYYSYLYAGLFLKEIETQWEKAGFPISNRVDVLSTLYNIGFEHSTPNANPQVGGAGITINAVTYSFGGLASQFYNSDLLTTEFPKQ